MNSSRSKSALSQNYSKRRHIVKHAYHDHALDKDDAESKRKQRKGPRGGVTTPFPVKLHMLLEENEYADIISWQPHGRCFLLHDPKQFLEVVMPRSFKQTKLTSFQRQLNLYGFSRLTSGPDKGGYYHELFLRGKRQLCSKMIRMRIKGTRTKAASDPESEPNFYNMPPVVERPSPKKTSRRISTGEPKNLPSKPSSSRPSYQVSPVCVSIPSSVSSSSTNSRPNSPLTDPPFLPPVYSAPMDTGPSNFRPSISNALSHQHRSTMPADRHPASKPDEQFSQLSHWPSLHDLSKFPDPFAQDDSLLFEGKGFHYLDSSAFAFSDADTNMIDDTMDAFNSQDYPSIQGI